MTFEEILVTDPGTWDADDARLSAQNQKIYGLLITHGQISNVELAWISLDYRGRIRDIRRFLKPKGQTVKCIYGKGGLNYYTIVKMKGKSGEAEQKIKDK